MSEEKELFSKRSIAFATFLGGPLAAAMLVYENMTTLGDDNAAKIAIRSGIIFTIVILLSYLFTPLEVIAELPTSLIQIGSTLIIILIVDKTQGKQISEHFKIHGKKASFLKAIIIGFINGAVFLVLFLSISYVKSPPEPKEMFFGDVGHQVIYQDGINAEDVKVIGNALLTMRLFHGKIALRVELILENGIYKLLMVFEETIWENEKFLYELKSFRFYLIKNVLKKDIELGLITYSNGQEIIKWIK